jgi:hypothetical protein
VLRPILPFLLSLFGASLVFAGDNPAENPAAKQFRQHLEKADQNKDGIVTREELVAEIRRSTGGDAATVEQIVSTMMEDLDTDHDGKLSAAEIDAGARKAGEHAATEVNVNRAKRVMDALFEYMQKHNDSPPAALAELTKLGIPAAALQCILADGEEKPWGYEPGDSHATGKNAVVLFSPGRVDSQGTYIVGLADGRVLGLPDTDLELEKVPRLKMNVNPGETPK